MEMNKIREEAFKLTSSERVRLADELYDSVGGHPASVRLTDAQVEELERRIDDYERNPGGARSWTEIRDAALAR